MHRIFTGLLFALAIVPSAARATAFSIDQPTADRWMYPFATNGGGQGAIQVFGAVGNADFDDRDGQMFLRFSTTSVIAAGLGAANYQLSSLKVTLTLSTAGTIYDPTSDSAATYLPGGIDPDAGRPIEIFGVGYRNGFTAATWSENSAFGPNAKGTRNAFALGYGSGGTAVDVSNNVTQGFEATPWATGTVAGITPGSALAADSQMTFTFNLSDASVLAYLQAGLNQGFLDLMVTSLYPAEQPGSGSQTSFPVFYSKESVFNVPGSPDPFDHVAGQLSGNLVAVPEPGTFVLVTIGGLALAGMSILRGRSNA